MNQEALVILGRNNLEKEGRSPFSAVASAFCVDADGVVATCWHNLANLLQHYSLVELPKRGAPPASLGALENHEAPWFAFFSGVGPPGELVMFPMLSGTGNVDEDIALVELGSPRRPGILPAVEISSLRANVGEFLHLIGHFQPPGTPQDPDGQTGGLAITHQGGRVIGVSDLGFAFDYVVPQGMSGSPVFRPDTGAVVGMVTETWPAGLTESRFGAKVATTWAVHISRVLSYMDKLRNDAARRRAAGGRPWCDLIGQS
jgi:hypothetical protein